MTFREKLTLEHPDCLNEDYGGGVRGCPSAYGYEERAEGPCFELGYQINEAGCTRCWDREIPESNAAEKVHEEFKKVVGGIKDSGNRREFESGAVRDMQEGKGRCDLMPLMVACDLFENDPVLFDVACYLDNDDEQNTAWLKAALANFAVKAYNGCRYTMLLEVAKHFEEGAKKYGENNWQKGLPASCYIDSAVRHYLKWQRGDKDEPHDRAFVWNLMCCIWEVDYSPRAKEET